MNEKDMAVDEFVDDASSVLLLAPSHEPADDEACTDLLTCDGAASTNVLSVTAEATPDERLSVWQREVGDGLPARATIVDAGSGVARSSQAASTGAFPAVAVETLPAEAGPVDLGMAIAGQLGEWTATEERTVLCLHSVSTLLDAFSTEAVIDLVNGLNERCERHDVLAHHHLDPAEHGEEILSALRPLYDAVVEHTPDGEWIVTADETSPLDPTFRETATPPGGAAKTAPGRPETIPIPHSFETVFDLLSVPRRRTLLYYLRTCEDEEIPLEQLADGVHEREEAIPTRDSAPSREILLTSLVHRHLPKLADAGVLDYDADERVVHYQANPALESCIRYIETLELG